MSHSLTPRTQTCSPSGIGPSGQCPPPTSQTLGVMGAGVGPSVDGVGAGCGGSCPFDQTVDLGGQGSAASPALRRNSICPVIHINKYAHEGSKSVQPRHKTKFTLHSLSLSWESTPLTANPSGSEGLGPSG